MRTVDYRAVPKRNARVVAEEIVRAGRDMARIHLYIRGKAGTVVLRIGGENIKDVGVGGAMPRIEPADVHITAQV